jgi:WD40 repeat protein
MQDDKRETSLEVNNEKALQQLAWAIENSAGKFKLILARCNYASLRSRLKTRLQEICQAEIRVLQLQKSGKTLYTAIHEEFGENLPVALMVLGLDSVQGLPQMLTSANQVREDFRKHFPFPLVLWINDDIYKQLMQFAPDLESWATSKNFIIAKDELGNHFRDIANLWFSNNLRLGIDDYLVNNCLIFKLELEAAQRDLLVDKDASAWELEADLESLLGFIEKFTYNIDAALKHYQKALSLWQQADNVGINLDNKLERQAKILSEICICYYLKAIKNTDKNHSDWQVTKRYIQEYLSFIDKNQKLDLINHDSVKFGEILRDLQEWETLKRLFNQALVRHTAENQPRDLARDYGFLAEAALGEENWQEANSYARQALSILSGVSEFESSRDASLYKCLLAKSQYYLGEKSEAIQNLEAAKELSNPLEDLKNCLDIFKFLQKLYFEQKEYLKAYEIKQEQFSIEQQFGLRAFIGAGRLQSFKGEAFTTQYNKNIKYSETISPEISASTRQLDVERLIERIGRNDCKLIVIYGQSGVGKSSLVNAGLEPALKNKAIGIKDNLPVVMRVYNNWQEELVKQIEENLFSVKKETLISPHSLQEKEIGKLDTAIFEQLKTIEQHNIRTVLIFDQFEEFFFVCTETSQRREFFEFLADCLNLLSVKVILSLRVDYLHYLLECNDLSSMNIIGNDILSNNVLYKVGNFTPSDAKSIIQRLTESANFPLKPALVDKLVEDLAGTLREVRPIELQIVGAQLQTENISSLAQYDLLGNKAKEELVKRYLQAVVENCGAENIQVAELLLYSLTDDKGTRPLKTRAELERDLQELVNSSSGLNLNQLNLVVDILIKSGLVLLLPEKPDDRYQLVHDYIAVFIRQQQEPKLKVLMEELQREREQRKVSETKLNTFLKRVLAGSIAAGFGFAMLALETNKQKQQADVNAVEAQLNSFEVLFTSGETRNASIVALKVAGKLKQGEEKTGNNQILTIAALREVVHSNYSVIELTTLTGHSDAVNGVAWNPDGKTLASASSDNTIKLWDASTGKPITTLTGHSDAVNGVAWNPDGKTLASASSDNTIKLWDASTGKLIKTLTGHSDAVNGVAWNPDGKTLASASSDNTIKLWDASTGKPIKTLTGHSYAVIDVAWNPDGKTLASASRDKTIKLWDASTGKLIKTLTGHSYAVKGVAWNPDGKTLASASWDNTIKLWDASTGKPIKTLTGHSDAVDGVAWNPDGKTLASASWDNTIKLWDASTGKPIKTLTGHSNAVIDVAWNPDGKTLASASENKTIILWDFDFDNLFKSACSRLEKYLAFDPEVLVDLKVCQTPFLLARGADMLVLQGEEQAKNGNVETAIKKFHQARKWNPQLDINLEKRGKSVGLVFTGREKANQEDLQGSIKDFQQAQQLDAKVDFEPDTEGVQNNPTETAKKLVAASWISKGTEKANQRDLQGSIKDFQQAQQLDAKVDFEPDTEGVQNNPTETAKKLVAASWISKGTEKANQRDLQGSIKDFQQAQQLDAKVDFEPDTEGVQNNPTETAKKLVAASWISKGTEKANQGDLQGSIKDFQQAQQLEDTEGVQNNLTETAKKLVAEFWIKKAEEYLKQKNFNQAVTIYTDIAKLQPPPETLAYSWGSLCWDGSLQGFAKNVVNDACKKAVSLTPTDDNIRDSRGLARALTGDSKGAISDFEAFIKSTQDAVQKKQRQNWVKELKAGKNPFTQEELEKLRQ